MRFLGSVGFHALDYRGSLNSSLEFFRCLAVFSTVEFLFFNRFLANFYMNEGNFDVFLLYLVGLKIDEKELKGRSSKIFQTGINFRSV